MASVCLPSDALSQHLPSYLGFSYLGRGVSLHSCFSKEQPLLLTLHERYLLMAISPDLDHGVAPLGPPAPAQPLLLGHVQAGFRKGRGTGDQIANIRWITEKAREFQKKNLFLLC